jgi:hypothetical protein
MVLNPEIWYSQRVGSSFHTLIKEKLMPELRTCHLPNVTALFCIGFDRTGLAKGLQRHGAHIVVSDITELGGLR